MVRKGVWIAVIIGIVTAGGFAIRAHADTLQTGVAAPDFSLPSQEDTAVSLSQYKGKWVVLYFYPKDMTSGCTIEAHNFQRDLPKYDALGAVVLGVSLDTVESHKTFCTKDSLYLQTPGRSRPQGHRRLRCASDSTRRYEVRSPRYVPHLAGRQDREGVDRRQPEHALRRRAS